ncbi:MAG: putative poly-gamma-glutamate synthesis protein [Anaerocolumna sp.]|jgi:poly-gamma-glutamate synthesis protein (capsule biosynthesis protein)|nr:putative poly-gamma-glutamate synthesis protein [Anaerocolumna sp.]
MRLIIGGDLVPTRSNIDLFSIGDVNQLAGEKLLSLLNAADFRIFNLEVPLTDKEDPIVKCGPNLKASTSTVKGIKNLNPSLLTLANNHILDQGEQGLKSTEQILTENDIPFVGVGKNLFEVNRSYVMEYFGTKIGIYACAEHEFTIATDASAGANPFDPLESLDHIKELKSNCDYVIVLYHGGKEHYRYPSPYLQTVCRKMVEKGADLVVCQHSHCIGCYEEYNDSTIVYGQGNFLFDHSESEFWKTSILLQIDICEEIKVDYIPIIKVGNTVRLANEKQKEEILLGFRKRSDEIKQIGFIEKRYSEFAKESFNGYLSALHGDNLVFRILNKLWNYKFARLLYSRRSILWMLNIVECEAHRELLLKGLTIRGKDVE